jgi:hypothetical protein
VLVLLVVGGCILVALPEYLFWMWGLGPRAMIGEAALVAILLGFIIDRWFK